MRSWSGNINNNILTNRVTASKSHRFWRPNSLCRCWFSQQNTVHKEFRGGGGGLRGSWGWGLRSDFGAPFLYVYVRDKFDHNKGQKSAISAHRLHWRLSTGFFCFFSSIYVQFSKTSPLKSGESSEKSSGENRVKSCHVCGCHGFFGPDMCFFGACQKSV